MASINFDDEKAAFREFYDDNRDNLYDALGSFRTLISSLLKTIPSVAVSTIGGRVKDREECISKFTRKYRTELEANKTPYTIRNKITDIIGLRIVCLYEDDVEKIKDLISSEFDVIEVTDKIAQIEGTESSFGYKGLHLDLRLNAARGNMAEYKIFTEHAFELQIRTVVQDSWSVIDHKIKYKKSIPNELKRRINTLAALFELADHEFKAIRDATKAELDQVNESYQLIEDETDAGEVSVVGDDKVYIRDRQDQEHLLNAFTFLRIAKHFFPNFDFEPHKVDGFTDEIITVRPKLSRGKFNYLMKETIADVKRYQAHLALSGDAINPYTVMRHCLYKGDKSTFVSMLTDTARDRFEAWLAENPAEE